MATDIAKQSFATELCSLTAALAHVGKLVSSLKELHDADIRRVVSDLSAKNLDLKRQLASTPGGALPHQVIETDNYFDDIPPISGKLFSSGNDNLRGLCKVEDPPLEKSEALPPQPPFSPDVLQDEVADDISLIADGSQVLSQELRSNSKDLGIAHSLGTDEAEGPCIGNAAISGTWTVEKFVVTGVRHEWEQASHESIAAIHERCSVQIIRDNGMERFVTTTVMMGSNESSASLCLAGFQDFVCGVMSPVGQFRFFWNGICLLFIAYDLFAVPMQVFEIDDLIVLQVCEWMLTVWWTLDVLLTFRTGYMIGSRVEMRARKIAWHYAKTWLLVDVIIVSLEWINRFAIAFASASLLRTSRAFRTLRFLKLFRVTKMHAFWKALQDQINSNVLHLLITMTILGAILILTMHVTACIWYAIGESRDDGWITVEIYSGEKTKLFWYVASFRWVVSQFNGRTDMDRDRNMIERFFTVTVGISLAVIAHAVFVSVITKTMLDLSELVSEKTKRQRVVNEYLEMNPLTPFLTSQVKRCLHDYQDANKELQNEDEVLAILPKNVQTDVVYEVRSPVVMQHHFFHSLHFESPWIMKFVCRRVVQTVSASKDEIIFEEGDVCDRMLFTDKLSATYYVDRSRAHFAKSGSVEFESEEMYADKTQARLSFGEKAKEVDPLQRSLSTLMHEPQIISMGSWVSEAAVWIVWRNQGRLTSHMHGLLLGVRASSLAQALKRHPDVFSLASLYGNHIATELRSTPSSRLSDILPFEVQLHSPLCVRITVESAAGLRNADGFFNGKSDPYCVCKVIGLTGQANETRFKTKVIDDCLNPIWNHTAEICLTRHQIIEFQVWDLDFPKKDTNLGVARLSPDDFYPQGFAGDLKLSSQSGGLAQGSLKVKVVNMQTEEFAQNHLWSSHFSKKRRPGRRNSFTHKN